MAPAPGLQRPWEEEESWGARIPGSPRTLDRLSYFPTPLVRPQAEAPLLPAASCKLSSKKTGREREAGVGAGVGSRKEKEVGGWLAKVGGGRWGVPQAPITWKGDVTGGPHPPSP